MLNTIASTMGQCYRHAEHAVKNVTKLEMHQAAAAGVAVGAVAIFVPTVLIAAGSLAAINAVAEANKS